jgi:transcription-repair coupling factor (superfamily II helicase)
VKIAQARARRRQGACRGEEGHQGRLYRHRIGTHAARQDQFANLGLLIIDEEQHFGVQHERLKQLREDVHVRAYRHTHPAHLQLALPACADVADLDPPVDRLAVRTYVTPFDPVILREARLRERYRGGQNFYVVPRISDLDDAAAFRVRARRSEGGPRPRPLRASSIGDEPSTTANMTCCCRPDRGSGLDHGQHANRAPLRCSGSPSSISCAGASAALRAYAYFTIPADARLTPAAEKRLKVLQSLDTLGAGFMASRPGHQSAGNLLGEGSQAYQEVGFELYQSMLEEAQI